MQTKSYSLYQLLEQFFASHEPVQMVRAGTVLFQEKESVESIYILLNGNISIGRVHMRGKELILKIVASKDVIIEYQVFTPNPRYHFSAKTMTDCQLLKIKKDKFEEFIQNDPDAMTAFATFLSTSYLKAQMKCQDLIMNGKKGGLYSILIRLCHSYGIITEEGILIDVPLTHQELANLTYGTREVIQRTLKELRELDVISYHQQKFTVKNLSFLKREVDCQNCPYEICGLN